MTTIDPETLREENGEDACVVVIRSEEDYEEDHIEGSEYCPIREALLAGDRGSLIIPVVNPLIVSPDR
jgi:rhodanese-related sulfurtransferase